MLRGDRLQSPAPNARQSVVRADPDIAPRVFVQGEHGQTRQTVAVTLHDLVVAHLQHAVVRAEPEIAGTAFQEDADVGTGRLVECEPSEVPVAKRLQAAVARDEKSAVAQYRE